MAPKEVEPPYYPIIYVRGYAGSDDEVEDTVSDPYMGFNLGSTKIRTAADGKTERYYFESPLVRLMKDFEYRDVYSVGVNFAEFDDLEPGAIDPRSIIIYRYYDAVSSTFGGGNQINMESFGRGLGELIIKLRNGVCDTNPESRAKFKVYLVGHSMGGLVIRAFLQNEAIGDPSVRALVDKVFTYATPHNGIELQILGNVPAFFTRNSADNFNRERMRAYLALPPADDDAPVNTLNGKFDIDRFFCLVGTNPKDYTVAAGWSARVVGPFSDGLVRINNATLFGPTGDAQAPTRMAPRAYVYRSHSGYFGIVNSEEGYQNLTRFLFGDVRVDGFLEIKSITLPASLQKERDAGKKVKASYHFECIARVRGALLWDLSRRVAEEHSTVFRSETDLFPEQAVAGQGFLNRPELFTVFLDANRRVAKRRASLGFSVDLRVLVPEYEVEGKLWLKDHFAGGYLYRQKINLEAIPPKNENETWTLRYGFDSSSPQRTSRNIDNIAVSTTREDSLEFRIPVSQLTQPGIDATLILTASPWND